ncbi:MAG: hypothetical protein KA501_12465 [Bacteroidia bacterium]|nr:hypothetical protein [Bacteroidia bacterium]
MSNLIGPNSGSPGSGFSSGGGGGGALIAVPLIVVASLSLRSGVVEGCGKQAVNRIDEFVPSKPPKKTFDDRTFPFDPYRNKEWENTKDHEKEMGDQIKDIGKDLIENTLEPKDSTDKKRH